MILFDMLLPLRELKWQQHIKQRPTQAVVFTLSKKTNMEFQQQSSTKVCPECTQVN